MHVNELRPVMRQADGPAVRWWADSPTVPTRCLDSALAGALLTELLLSRIPEMEAGPLWCEPDKQILAPSWARWNCFTKHNFPSVSVKGEELYAAPCDLSEEASLRTS